MRDYTSKTGTYRILDMPAKTAFHVSRKLAPAISGFSGLAGIKDSVLAALEPPPDETKAQADFVEKLAVLLEALHPLFQAVSAMPEEDVDYILETCLSYVQRVETTGSQMVFNARAKRFQYEIKMYEMLELTAVCLLETFSDFFPTKG